MDPGDLYNIYREGILRARLIRQDLERHPTEYYPDKVRGLNESYIDTIKEVIKRGDEYIDMDANFEKGLEVAQVVETYKAFLSTLGK